MPVPADPIRKVDRRGDGPVKRCNDATAKYRVAPMRILCVGEALVDLVCEHPVGSISEADAFVPHFGGAIANVAVTAARRGADVALAGGVGDDAWGHWLRERLAAEGVGLDCFALAPGIATPIAFVTLDAAAQPTFAIYGEGLRAAVAGLGEGRLLEAVDAAGALFFSSNTLVAEDERALTLAARDRARAAGKPIVLDPNLRLERWRSTSAAVEVVGACVDGAFLVKCNGYEALALTGELEVEAAAASLLAAGAQHVVVTLGPDGALLRGGGLDRTVRGVSAQPIDTTGAGDAVTGVLLAGLARTGFYPAALAAMLPDAVAEGARATERYGALA
jgi:sugar/nucleoside kinase (ribokinase family)